MNRDLSQLFDPHLGTKVLQVLNRIQTLPAAGFIAGQAVASAIDEVLGTGTPIYNDLDIFAEGNVLHTHNPELRSKEYRRRRGGPKKTMLNSIVSYKQPVGMEYESYTHRLFLATRDLYTVKESFQDGMLNLVEVYWGAYNPPAVPDVALTRQQHLISAFDLNNVQVCVDIETGRLVTSKAFQAYFRDRQLRACTTYTPAHTLIRAMKKAKELPEAYLNKQETLLLLSSAVRANEGGAYVQRLRIEAMQEGMVYLDIPALGRGIRGDKVEEHFQRHLESFMTVGAGVLGAPLVMGSKFSQLYEDHADDLRTHLGLVPSRHGNLFLATASADAPALQLAAWPDTAESRAKLDRILALTPPLVAAASGTQLLQGTGRHSQEARIRARMENLIKDFSSATRIWLEDAMYAQENDFFKDFTSEKDLVQLCKDMREHPEIVMAVGMLGLKDGLRLTRRLRRAFEKHRIGAAWGVLASLHRLELLELLNSDEFLDERCVKLKGSDKPLVEPMPGFPMELDVADDEGVSHKVVVRELTNGQQLVREGLNMGHCVGGYGPMVEMEHSRILHMELPGSRPEDGHATVEWQPRGANFRDLKPVKVRLGQIFSVRNTPAHPVLVRAEEQVRQRVNQWLSDNMVEGWELMVPTAYARYTMSGTLSAQKEVEVVPQRGFDLECPF